MAPCRVSRAVQSTRRYVTEAGLGRPACGLGCTLNFVRSTAGWRNRKCRSAARHISTVGDRRHRVAHAADRAGALAPLEAHPDSARQRRQGSRRHGIPRASRPRRGLHADEDAAACTAPVLGFYRRCTRAPRGGRRHRKEGRAHAPRGRDPQGRAVPVLRRREGHARRRGAVRRVRQRAGRGPPRRVGCAGACGHVSAGVHAGSRRRPRGGRPGEEARRGGRIRAVKPRPRAPLPA